MQSATKSLRQPSTVLLFAMLSLAAGCSTDAVRFEDYLGSDLVTNSVRTSNQKTIIKPSGQKLQAFDRSPDAGSRRSSGIGRLAAKSNPASLTALPRTTSRTLPLPKVSRSELPPVTETLPVRNATPIVQSTVTASTPPAVLAPSTSAPSPLRRIDERGVVTGSVAPKAQAVVKRAAGWSAVGGSSVTLQSGDTIQGLSRRFGVPVKAILSANGLSNARSAKAGQRIIIPAYSRGQRAPAPSKPAPAVATAPTSVSATPGQTVELRPKSVPATRPVAPTRVTQPTRAVRKAETVSQSSGTHVVESGQTLYSISRKYNVRLDALRAANSLSGDDVRVGQKLVVPGDGYMEANVSKPAVDPVVTGSLPKKRDRATPVEKPVAKVPAKAETKTASVDDSSFRWPARGRTLARFGATTARGANDGIDIAVPTGTPVRAARSGMVIYAGNELEEFGNLVLLSHAGGFVTAYANASSMLVKRGQRVNAGDVIAKSGATGTATQPQLHFEIRKNSQPVNPMIYLSR